MSKLSEVLEARHSAIVAERDALLDVDPKEFDAAAQARFDELDKEVRELEARKAAAEADAEVAKRAAEAVRPAVTVTNEPNPVYRKGDNDTSYFRDLFNASTSGDMSARQRLADSQERALSTTAAAGGTFAPPVWMVEDYVKLARAARVTADLMNTQPLPGGVSSINLPAVATGTAVGVTQAQNTAVQNTDITTTSISSGITTISGQQVVSLQLMKQSGIPFDRVILEDLALAYAAQLDTQVLNGSNANGQLKGLATAGTTVTFTTTTPYFISSTAAGSFYNKLIAAQTNIAKNRYLPADAIVMHPTRWGWALQGLDGQGRLQIAPNGPVFNAPAITGEPVAQGYAGTLAGLPVYVDPNIPQNLGAATNQDQVFVLRRGDHWLYETPIEATTWEATYANQNSVLFRVLGFAAFITRYSASAQVIDGTGLVTPTL